MAQPDPHPGRGRPPSGVVARRLAHRVVQRRGRRVRPGRRRAGRVGPAPHRHPRAVVLLPAPVVARRREAGVHRHPLPAARPRRGVGRGGPRRHRPLRPPRAVDEPGVVSRLAVDRVRAPARQPVAGHRGPRHEVGRDAPAHRRDGRRHRARLGRVGQVSVLPGLHRLRAQHGLARHDVLRPSRHPRPLPGAAAGRRAVALPAAERRGGRGGRAAGRRGRGRGRRRCAPGRGDRRRGHRPAHRRRAGAAAEELHGAAAGSAGIGVRGRGRRRGRAAGGRGGAEVHGGGPGGGGLRRGRDGGHGLPRPRAPALPRRLELAHRRHRRTAGRR